MAMMMARLYTGAHDIITLRNAYHGLSGGCALPLLSSALVCCPLLWLGKCILHWTLPTMLRFSPPPRLQRRPWACLASTAGSTPCPRQVTRGGEGWLCGRRLGMHFQPQALLSSLDRSSTADLLLAAHPSCRALACTTRSIPTPTAACLVMMGPPTPATSRT